MACCTVQQEDLHRGDTDHTTTLLGTLGSGLWMKTREVTDTEGHVNQSFTLGQIEGPVNSWAMHPGDWIGEAGGLKALLAGQR